MKVSALGLVPRLLTREQAAWYLQIEPSTLLDCVRSGLLPGPLAMMNRWDRKAIDASLDRASGLTPIAARRAKEPVRQPHSDATYNIKGIARATKVLADGSKRVYLYAWRGGPLLKDAAGNPLQPGDDQISKAYAAAVAQARPELPQTLDILIDEFKASSEYTTKSRKTRRGYDLYIARMRAHNIAGHPMVDQPLDAVQDPSARGIFKVWRDTMADKPRTADYAWATLARILSVAKDNGRIAVNVCQRGGRLYAADRAEKIWEPHDIAAMMNTASRPLRMALMMALWTGQREGDLLRAPWSAYDGTRIKLRQGKTGARVNIPVGAPLKAFLDESARSAAPTILTNTYGKAWTEGGFRATWNKACKKAGIEGLTFHDIRGTAVTRLALAGCSAAQIGSITGHSLRDVEAILDAHYLGGRIELAEQAMAKLEKHMSDAH